MSRSRTTRFTPERIALVLACVVACGIYSSLLRVPFLSWDDELNISANPYFLHIGWWKLWYEPYFGLYVPVTSSVWAALLNIGSGSAWLFRTFNMALHVANMLLVWRLVTAFIRRVSPGDIGPQTGIAVVAGVIVFALHPVQTATVAWISGGRDLLATCFGLAAVLVYFRGTRASYVLATALFTAGMLSKPSIAAIPVAVIAYVALFERAHIERTAREMALWCLLVVGVALGTSAVQSNGTDVTVPIYQRPLVVLDAIGFYVRTIVAPTSLSIDHGRTPAWVWSHPAGAAVNALIAAAAIAGLGYAARRHRPYAVALLGLVLIAPVIGIATFAFQHVSTVADHYLYLPMAAVACLVAITLNELVRSRAAIWTIAFVFLIAGGSLSLQRSRVWHSSHALFEDALSKNPRSWLAMISLGGEACRSSQFDRGLDLLGRALELDPANGIALGDKAYCLFNSGHSEEVIEMQGMLLDPAVRHSFDHNDAAASGFANVLAGAYLHRGQITHAWAFLCQALAVSPYDADIAQNAADVRDIFAQRGVAARCPGLRPWADLAPFEEHNGG